MRVIAGKFKSRRLRTLRGMSLRPTSDRLRETLFDILGDAVVNCFFADLFAGTGAVGIEAVSRGAHHAVFIERQTPAVQLIRENLKSLSIGAEAELLAMDVLLGLKTLKSKNTPIDFIFLDPPYAEARDYHRALEWIGANQILSASGLVIVEHANKLELPLFAGKLERIRIKVQGDSALSFYRGTRTA